MSERPHLVTTNLGDSSAGGEHRITFDHHTGDHGARPELSFRRPFGAATGNRHPPEATPALGQPIAPGRTPPARCGDGHRQAAAHRPGLGEQPPGQKVTESVAFSGFHHGDKGRSIRRCVFRRPRVVGQGRHPDKRCDPADGLLRERPTEGQGPEQTTIDIDRGAAHPGDDSGVTKPLVLETNEHHLAFRRPRANRPDDRERDLNDLAAVHLGDADPRRARFDLGGVDDLDRLCGGRQHQHCECKPCVSHAYLSSFRPVSNTGVHMVNTFPSVSIRRFDRGVSPASG